jgi:hypothetical protein
MESRWAAQGIRKLKRETVMAILAAGKAPPFADKVSAVLSAVGRRLGGGGATRSAWKAREQG